MSYVFLKHPPTPTGIVRTSGKLNPVQMHAARSDNQHRGAIQNTEPGMP